MAQKPRNATQTFAISILAGGLSTRMGRDKSKLRLGRRTLLGHVRARAQKLGLPIRIIRKDAVPRCGPLGGIYTALQSSRARAELFLSCDMPLVSPRLLREVLAQSSFGQKPVFTTQSRGVGFPFVLPVSCLATVETQIKRKDFSIQSLAKKLNTHAIKCEPGELLNINTPADLLRAKEVLDAIRAG